MVVDLFPKYVWRQKEGQYVLSCFPESRIRLDEGEYKLMADLMERAGVSVPVIGRSSEKEAVFQAPKEMAERLEKLLRHFNEWEVLPIQELDDILKNSSVRRRHIVKKALISIYEYSRNGYYAAIRP
ncbi:MAG: hypothetical protein GX234_04085 [Clostridiales bacterium]|nr:hypothetical protein [Clostridiales bacterium]